MLPFKQAIRIPIFVNRRTEIISLSGKITLLKPVRTGMIQFNNFNDEFLGKHHWRRIEINGEVVFQGDDVYGVGFGVGSVLFVRKGGKIIFGNNILIGGKSKLLCEESITIGSNVRIAHESQIMDSNFHYIKNINTGNVDKCTAPIVIGNNNWIGNRTTIMKGTQTPDFLIVAAGSLLNRDYTKEIPEYSIIGGSPAKFIKNGYERIFDLGIENEYNKKFKRIL